MLHHQLIIDGIEHRWEPASSSWQPIPITPEILFTLFDGNVCPFSVVIDGQLYQAEPQTKENWKEEGF